jgi:hypothetical protein
MSQRRQAYDARQQMLAQMLATPQQQQGPPQQSVPTRQVVHGPPAVQASPWSILGAGLNAFINAYRQQGQNPGNISWWLPNSFTSNRDEKLGG